MAHDSHEKAVEAHKGHSETAPPPTSAHHAHHLHGGHSSQSHQHETLYGDHLGQVRQDHHGVEAQAKVDKDGRVNIRIDQETKGLQSLLLPALRTSLDLSKVPSPPAYVPPSLAGEAGKPPPPLNIVIMVVGSRGDVQPFVALGKVLKDDYGHRVRLATHPVFKDFVEDNGLEFFSIAGDPSELMAFMVRNPGLMPGLESLRRGDVGRRRREIGDILEGCWRACIEAGDGLSSKPDYAHSDEEFANFNTFSPFDEPPPRPFVADAIISNPPSFAHIHCAEKLGIPLHMMFTMPWSPTQSFPHPLANIQASNADAKMTNFMSYALVDMLTWQGLGDVINRFREKTLGLDAVSLTWAPGMLARLKVPWTYCWSPALIPKPRDWSSHIDISGFYFLTLGKDYKPAPELADFLAAGPPPVYIGFGSIVVDDPNAMTKLIFDAVKKSGQRALVSKGWGGFGADEIGIPDGVFMLGNVPHDWLFQHVSCVVHHGGAGTTAAGITAGKPTIVVPFFGDQPFWGAMVARAGAGPTPIPNKQLTADNLAAAIKECMTPDMQSKAKAMSEKIKSERGTQVGARSFHKELQADKLRCQLSPNRTAVWRIRRTQVRLSAFAATVLAQHKLIDFKDLKLYRAREYNTEDDPWDPITGATSALMGTIGSMVMGIADLPVGALKALKIHPDANGPRSRSNSNASNASNPVSPSNSRNASPGGNVRTRPRESTISSISSQSDVHARARSTSNTRPREATVSHYDGPGSKYLRSPEPAEAAAQSTPQYTPPSSAESSRAASPALEQPAEALNALEQVDTATGAELQRESTSMSTATTIQPEITRVSSSSTTSSRRSRADSKARLQSVSHTLSQSLSHTLSNAPTIDVEAAMQSGRGGMKIISAGFKSPMEFTMALAKGFHNAPKLYGDDTVRENAHVTNLSSGLKAAGRGFAYGISDGISGLVTQPLHGARKEGAAGFIKGFGKGIGGVILKPSAAFWSLPGYTSRGIYLELHKAFGPSSDNYILASRTAQGFDEVRNSTVEEQKAVTEGWKELKKFIHKKKNTGEQQLEELQRRMSEKMEALAAESPRVRESWCVNRVLERSSTQLTAGTDDTALRSPDDSEVVLNPLSRSHTFNDTVQGSEEHHDAEIEEAIRRSVLETSKGDKARDAEIERAIRASIADIQQKHEQGADDDEMGLAMQTRVDDAHKGIVPDVTSARSSESDEEMRQAVVASLKSHAETAQEAKRQEREEEIVMQYVQKQSLLEEELRKGKEASTAAS